MGNEDGNGGGERGTMAGLDALVALQENASSFFARLEAANGARMTCRRGCSACCHVDLTVFESEAARILAWASGLDDEAKRLLADGLERAEHEAREKGPGRDAAGNVRAPCVFLVDDACAVYPARPVICRTQGAALQWRAKPTEENARAASGSKGNKGPKPGKGESEVTELVVDACPLNFDGGKTLPPAPEWLDLDRLAVLQTLAERQYQDAKAQDAPAPKVGDGKSADGRIPLRDVRTVLLRKLRRSERTRE